ncbi:hypothetical protein CPB84DRAFT_1908080 [Gymnopilus junonius]|uniref:RanBD1 domain-containing protein n=1 Tax=Gymnopilus junonius TaxID=109634 RepID=A0A9P5TN93_GYMJU|nr:hypothetical protein CPB84DRAFT_1908080 [Gymnopilus junonius]
MAIVRVGFSRAEGKWLDPCIPLNFIHNTSTAMSDVPEVVSTPPPSVTKRLASPPRLTPSPDATESELKLSRKREREVSLEPATTPSTAHNNDSDSLVREHKDIPLKKNRRRLDPTEEEEDVAGSGGSGSGSPPSPPILASPRQEMKRKVRQISRGVEDINWKNIKPVKFEKETDVEINSVEPIAEAVVEDDADPGTHQELVDNDDKAEENDSPPKTPDDSILSRSVQDVRNIVDSPMPTSPEAPKRLRAGSESQEKGLKRKFLERGTSHGPPENGESSQQPSEPLKRPRDEANKDDNPRETKRPTPPPSPPRPSPPSPKVPKLAGFMAYASTSSPFASVKGKNIFSKAAPTPPPASSSPAPSALSTPATESIATFGQSSTFGQPSSSTAATPTKWTSGFEAFAAKSPPRKTPSFSPNQAFAAPSQKRARADSPDGSARSSLERTEPVNVLGGSGKGSDSGDDEEREETTSFGDKLRATKDDDDESKWDEDSNKPQLTAQPGEEGEKTIHSARGKLFTLDGMQWRERGTGTLRLNVDEIDSSGPRLVMRKDAVHTLLLNVTLFAGMHCVLSQDPRYVMFSAIEDGVTTTYNLKVSNAKIAAELFAEIKAQIKSLTPSASDE